MEDKTLIYKQNELYHYGVKGMRWGIVNTDDTGYTSWQKRALAKRQVDIDSFSDNDPTKQNLKNEYQKQGDAYRRNNAAIRDAQRYSSGKSTGKNVAKVALLNSGSQLTYDMARANGEGRIKAALRTILDINVSNLAGGAAGAIARTGANAAAKALGANDFANARFGDAASAVTSAAVNYAVTKNMAEKGRVVSLQQRALAKKYHS